MTRLCTVRYDGSVLHPETPLNLEKNGRYSITIQPILPEAAVGNLWNLLTELAGTVDAPVDWASEHDHYLYGTAKRAGDGKK